MHEKNGIQRCFAALAPDPEAQTAVYEALSGWRESFPDLRWLHPSDLHLTLRFFGDLDERGRRAAERALLGLESAAPVRIEFDSFTLLPARRNPRVLALTVSDRASGRALAGLKSLYDRSLTDTAGSGAAAFPEPRAGTDGGDGGGGVAGGRSSRFLPHLTVARFAPRFAPDPADLREDFCASTVKFETAVLYRSLEPPRREHGSENGNRSKAPAAFRSGEPRYAPLASVRLRGSAK